MHSGMSWWTERSMEWFDRASSWSDYHERLSDFIELDLEGGCSVIEAGCGLGYEAQILSERGYSIKAFDSERRVIDSAAARSGLDIFSCQKLEDFTGKADILLCVNFGHIENRADLGRLLSHAGRRLVYIVSRHSGHGVETRPDRTRAIEELLKEEGLKYNRRDLSLRFDQPLASLDEARDFIQWTYLGNEVDKYMEFVHKTDGLAYPYVFRNIKTMAQYSIDVSKN